MDLCALTCRLWKWHLLKGVSVRVVLFVTPGRPGRLKQSEARKALVNRASLDYGLALHFKGKPCEKQPVCFLLY